MQQSSLKSLRSTSPVLFRRLLPLALVALGGCKLANFPLIDSAGSIGQQETKLIFDSFLIMLIPVVPVIVMTFWFAWRYRASNKSATYKPRWGHSNAIEIVVWTVPILIVIGLAILTWNTTHRLDPYKPLVSDKKPVHVEAIALNWKWLFIYPDQGIASVNQLVIPKGVPVSLKLTSDTVMTSFFIPRLGTQIYAMAGMKTRLHLVADKTGTFTGWNSQLSGEGFESMHFKTISTSEEGFQSWVSKVKQSPDALTADSYAALEKPSTNQKVVHYSSIPSDDLFSQVVMKYMHGPMPKAQPAQENAMHTMKSMPADAVSQVSQ